VGTPPELRLIEGGRNRAPQATTAVLEFARALAHQHFAAMMQQRKADSQ
jgi:hypothetical protein